MSIAVAGVTFDHVTYDVAGDVLYLHVGDPATATEFEESPEGHALRLDTAGNLIGITFVNAKWLLEQDDPLAITIPERVLVDRSVLAPAIRAA